MIDKNVHVFLEARRHVIASCFGQLNDVQRDAVMCTEGPLLLLAGAGSGKTTVLINRIANLIRFGCASDSEAVPEWITDEDAQLVIRYASTYEPALRDKAEELCALNPVNPWRIIAITFTNKAANELKDRLNTMLGEKADGVWAMTFHAACCRILRRNIDYLGYNSDFTIYDSSDSEKLMKDIIKELGIDEKSFPAKSVLAVISDAKDRMESSGEMMKRAKRDGDVRAERVAQAYSGYEKRLRAANALDFDDIILLTVRLLDEYEDVRDYYQKKFQYVLIDEYQDTNNLQYRLASLLSGRYENICVVGDDDQSIYRFRGATIENILSFESQYTGARVIRLEQNYRSTGYILDAANAVIAHNRGRKGKTLWTANGQGNKVVVHESANENSEGEYVASEIIKGKANGNEFKDYAVLYRTNAQSNALEMSFKRNGIPYRIIGGTRFFDRAEIKDMLAYLHLINNPADDLRLRRIINLPARGIGAKSVELVERQANAAGLSLFSVLSSAHDYASLEKSANKLKLFSELILFLQKKSEEMPLDEFYDIVLMESGYIAMLEAKDTDENRNRKENVRELKSSIIAYMESTEQPTLRGFLEEVSLYTDIEQNNAEADAVVMMTMHSAKGLEFPVVFVVGAEDGLFPGMKVLTDPTELEEERRLCYVAITRAQKKLYFTWARQRMLYGRTTFNKKSRFLDEIPETCVAVTVRASYNGGDQRRYESKPNYGSYYSEKKRSANVRSTTAAAKTVVELHKGEIIQHTAFGRGMVLNVLPVGGDALIEVAFDQVGTKRLMLKTASSHIRKING